MNDIIGSPSHMSVTRKEDITYKKSEKEDIQIVTILVNSTP